MFQRARYRHSEPSRPYEERLMNQPPNGNDSANNGKNNISISSNININVPKLNVIMNKKSSSCLQHQHQHQQQLVANHQNGSSSSAAATAAPAAIHIHDVDHSTAVENNDCDITPLLTNGLEPVSPQYNGSSISQHTVLYIEGISICSKISLYYYYMYRRLIVCLMILIMMGLLCYYIIIPAISLKLTTGSMYLHSYDYYSARNTAKRLYPQYFTGTSGNYSESAISEIMAWQCPTPVPLSLPSTADSSIIADASSTSTSSSSSSSVAHFHHLYIVVCPEHWTVFPWFWDSILINHTYTIPTPTTTSSMLTPTERLCTPSNPTCWRCPDNNNTNAGCHKYFPDHQLHITLINAPISTQLLPHIEYLLIIGEHMEISDIFDYLHRPDTSSLLHPELHLSTLMLLPEECHSPYTSFSELQQRVDPRISLMFNTYGDCHLDPQYNQLKERDLPSSLPIQIDRPIVYWPLGPSCEHGFPSILNPADNPSMKERSILLNMMVTHSPGKPTRMQAWLVAREYCATHTNIECYLHTNDYPYKIAEFIDQLSDGRTDLKNWSPIAAPALQRYLPLLRSSRFTLCPSGKNPEQYRIWEAIMAGSIPIIEWPRDEDTYNTVHPAYGTDYRCTPTDVHRVLRQYRAPVLYVRDWSELPQLLNNLTLSDLEEMQDNLQNWYQYFVRELQREVFERIKAW